MSGFAGFYRKDSLLCNSQYHYNTLSSMIQTQKHRKKTSENYNLILTDSFALSQTCRIQTIKKYNKTYHLLLCGEIYNRSELLRITETGSDSSEADDAELLLLCYLAYGEASFVLPKGCFSFALIIEEEDCIYLVRDALGCKPVFYSLKDETFLFGTEPKALLAHPLTEAAADLTCLRELLLIGPAHTPGLTLFKDIKEVKAGCFVRFRNGIVTESPYWSLTAKPHTDSESDTIEKTAELVRSAILQQSKPYDKIACLLSGGIDSSIVTAVCASILREKNLQLKTYSFDYEENETYFQSNAFQPSLDKPYVDMMVSHFETDHTYLTCSQKQLFDTLDDSLICHDMPPMGDVDASLLYFCRKIAPEKEIVLTGECADEVFGGYPWFHREDLLSLTTFPWSRNLMPRILFLNDDILKILDATNYIESRYEQLLQQISYLPAESSEDRAKRRNGYLSLCVFGATLLNRMERCGAGSGLCARVPFADRDLVEYIYNVPWNIKLKDGVVKSLLREAFRKELPENILWRKKSPYPKTYHPQYEELLRKKLTERIADTNCPLHKLIDAQKLRSYINEPKDYTTPWYGQLMAGPQMLAYLLQIDSWMNRYGIQI